MNEDIKQRPNRCPHMNCAVVHTGQCNCDMTEHCFQCRQGVLNQSTKVMTMQDLKDSGQFPVCPDKAKKFKKTLTFRAWDGEKWHYRNLFLSYDGKLWLRYDGRKLKEVDWELEFNYKQDEAHD